MNIKILGASLFAVGSALAGTIDATNETFLQLRTGDSLTVVTDVSPYYSDNATPEYPDPIIMKLTMFGLRPNNEDVSSPYPGYLFRARFESTDGEFAQPFTMPFSDPSEELYLRPGGIYQSGRYSGPMADINGISRLTPANASAVFADSSKMATITIVNAGAPFVLGLPDQPLSESIWVWAGRPLDDNFWTGTALRTVSVSLNTVPEPSSLLLVLAGVVALPVALRLRKTRLRKPRT